MGITAQQFKQMEDRLGGIGRAPSPALESGLRRRSTRTR